MRPTSGSGLCQRVLRVTEVMTTSLYQPFLPPMTNDVPEISSTLLVTNKDSSLKDRRLTVRARKHHWTEEEDAELDKGFRRYGYQWNLMVKDPDLHFDKRSGGQIRDRFRLRFPEVYNQQDANSQQKKHADKKSSDRRPAQASSGPTRKKSSDPNELIRGDDGNIEAENRAALKATTTPSFTTGLLNAEDEDNRLSNSILHDDWDWNENLTLAPVAWEDMANKPMFSFD